MSAFDALDDITDEYDAIPGLNLRGTCQHRFRNGKRCHFRAEVQQDTTAYCEKHSKPLNERADQ